MADAKVIFETSDGDPADPGAEQTFTFNCPKHDRRCGGLVIAHKTDLKRDGQNCNGGIAQWDWDHVRDRPTFTPSINCGKCWHGFIRVGRTVGCDGNDEPPIERVKT